MRSLSVFFITSFIHRGLAQGSSVIYNTNGTASQPIASNLLPMLGFNFTNLTSQEVILYPATETWSLQLNYSIEPLGPLATDRPSPVQSYALRFPEGQLPSQNETTWTLCAHIVQFPFPNNITNIAPSSGASKGDCTPYLGSSCVNDYISAFKTARRLNDCASPPLFSEISSCRDRIGHQTVQSIISFPIMDWRESTIRYNTGNKTYTNTSNGQIVTNAPVRGLRSGEVFWKQGPGWDALDNVTRQQEEASTLQFIGFSLSPSKQWITDIRVVSWANFSDVRVVCGRANASYNGTITGAASTSDGMSAIAYITPVSLWAALIVIVAAVLM